MTVVAAGRVSDRLQLRRPFALGGTAAGLVMLLVLVWLLGRESVSVSALMVTGLFLGGLLGTAYAPWMANFSEDAENIDPRLQGTAWGLFSFLVKAMAVVVLLVVPQVVAASSWQVWMAVTVVCMALFGVAICFFEGPWRRGPDGIGPYRRRAGTRASAASASTTK